MACFTRAICNLQFSIVNLKLSRPPKLQIDNCKLQIANWSGPRIVSWRWPLALPFFAVTLFVAAFLLFLVQPMIGKMILPKLGGTPQVWNTCMLFFQTVLLAGYFYTHAATTYLRPRKQMILHGILLFLPLAVMLSMGERPFDVRTWVPPVGSNPIFATLLLLLTIVG